MAVEGYLNFYGVLRLGQQAFNDHFERLGSAAKLRALLLVCDGLEVARDAPIVKLLERISKVRNDLAHPKAREVEGDMATHQRARVPVPETAKAAVQAMEDFFDAFIDAVPAAQGHLARPTVLLA
jgi:hypothetical protein